MPTAIELAEQFQVSLVGDGSRLLRSLAPLERAQSDEISFLSNPLYRQQALASGAGALIVSDADFQFLKAHSQSAETTYFVSKNPYASFAKMAQWFAKQGASSYSPGISPMAVVDKTSKIPASCHIGPFVQIGPGVSLGERTVLLGQISIGEGASLGDDCLIYPNVTIYHDCVIGDRCIVHSGAVIGADGFGFAPDFSSQGGQWLKIPQTGGVRIGQDVEVGACTTIDRGAMANTMIGDGCKIDNQVQIAHNVVIGIHTVIAGCAAIAGSTTIGNYCVIGGNANFAGHLQIADRTTVSGGTPVIRSITESGTHITGVFPSMPHSAWERNAAILRGLDKIRERIRDLESKSSDSVTKPD
ncbi:UDP-3-O-(3-hydroxymyristoyl)glucosamine N-acyltransferase [Polynucleobacter sp. HIN8]|uniref:UDP-3-O-(3-hydroxymyristoyl)glucosamine N-acyltransferase n=1 Tax=Polynucleobacter sp. HIN8 TaxID=3047867 RepID=UPI002574394F|nr:UDP-3-O-(3-hydroxymyristoyl)glucosamine N-acyltransferase [Polynucleobacter sp. HIN8]BEI38680.1 UDP-3-O-(3-hydroxymyristoyl)glucosamine N-acyltransferase [Polynucleobacter sp. HIN8]